MTINKVIDICNEMANSQNIIISCPIKENGRLSTTLGRVCYNEEGIEVIEFSKKLLQFCTDDEIINTIRHELAHAFVYWQTGKSHGHDIVWRNMVIKLGGKPERTTEIKTYLKEPEKIYKYTIYCEKCGKLIGARDRACSIIKNPKQYHSKCCDSDLIVKQNW